jgi:alpha-beta hydrolase superfamily lysophospholipase
MKTPGMKTLQTWGLLSAVEADREEKETSRMRCTKSTILCTALVIATLSSWEARGMAAPPAGEDASPTTAETACRNVAVPVVVAGRSGAIAGTLCVPPGATTVQLLVPGWTYNRFYWDVPYQPDTYSYVRAANRAGYATLAIDRLGTGASLHPPSATVTLQAHVRTVHEVVGALRDGSLGVAFPKVVGVGHSLGSIVVAQAAGVYGDFDALVTTGYSHVFNYSTAVFEVGLRDHLAAGDPTFAALGLDPGYLTSQPGMRARMFHYAPNTDPAMEDIEEALLEDTGTVGDAATILGYPLDNPDRRLAIPVLVVNGDRDRLYCGLYLADCTTAGTLAAHERQFYGPGAAVEAFVVQGAGHDLSLERTAPSAAQRMLEFVERYVGHGDGAVGAEPGMRPEVVVPQRAQPPAPIAAANAAYDAALLPLADAYNALVGPIPGLGDAGHSTPVLTAILARIASTTNEASGNLLQDLLEG